MAKIGKIEKNVALPRTQIRGQWDVLEKMQPGDSIVINEATYGCVSSIMYNRQRKMRLTKPDVKFTFAKIGDASFRIWRVS
jgi:hypothetical protein